MDALESAGLRCPYCGEWLELTIDRSAGPQRYIEDCQVCCRPLELSIAIGRDGTIEVGARRDDE